jgi:pimeloyl-ACP methyl ester carboxylesterase
MSFDRLFTFLCTITLLHPDYCVAAPPASSQTRDDNRPAILLVHGFGAFGDQWRGNLAALAEAGYNVFAPTLPGWVMPVLAGALGGRIGFRALQAGGALLGFVCCTWLVTQIQK